MEQVEKPCVRCGEYDYLTIEDYCDTCHNDMHYKPKKEQYEDYHGTGLK